MTSNNTDRLYLRRWLLTLCFGLLAHVCFAQLQDTRNNLAIGFNGGVNFSSVDFTPRIGQFKQPGKSVGFTVRYITERYFKMISGIQFEVNYSERGWKENIDDGSGDSYARSLRYIEIPFLAHLSFGKDRGHGARVFINAGPQMGYYLSQKEFRSESWDPSFRPNHVVAQYNLNVAHKFEYGITAGAGAEVRTGLGNFIVEGRYYFGLSDIFGNSKKDFFGRSANTYMGVRLCYLFDLLR